MTVDELIAREEIRQLMATYSQGGDRGRIDILASVFHDDGVLDGRKRSVGPAEIERNIGFRRIAETGPDRRVHLTRHNMTTSKVTFESPTVANGRTYFFVTTDTGPDHQGVYVDRFEKRDGVWKIAERKVRIDWVAADGHAHVTRKAAS